MGESIRVRQKLASGGMADLYLCELRGIGGFKKLLVAKVVRPEVMIDGRAAQMFLDEARLSASLSHPNIVQIFDIRELGGLPVILMEYIGGPTLLELMRAAWSGGETELGLTLHLFVAICRGLHYAHELPAPDGSPARLVHRDISLDNILISRAGIPKLIDFGIAHAREKLSKTRTGVVMGKLQYMAPEQLDGAPIDRRADIYALGMCLYRATTGRKPFPGSSVSEVMRSRLLGPPPRPGDQLPWFPAELERVILKATAEDPEDRWQSAEALGRAISACIPPPQRGLGAPEIAAWVERLERASGACWDLPPPAAEELGTLEGLLARRATSRGATPGPDRKRIAALGAGLAGLILLAVGGQYLVTQRTSGAAAPGAGAVSDRGEGREPAIDVDVSATEPGEADPGSVERSGAGERSGPGDRSGTGEGGADEAATDVPRAATDVPEAADDAPEAADDAPEVADDAPEAADDAPEAADDAPEASDPPPSEDPPEEASAPSPGALLPVEVKLRSVGELQLALQQIELALTRSGLEARETHRALAGITGYLLDRYTPGSSMRIYPRATAAYVAGALGGDTPPREVSRDLLAEYLEGSLGGPP